MRDIIKDALRFDDRFPDFGDRRYSSLVRDVKIYSNIGFKKNLGEPSVVEVLQSVAPLIELRNYKSTIPMTKNLLNLLELVHDISVLEFEDTKFANDESPRKLFLKLISMEGILMPSASAVFHFCHPNKFPIVDRYVSVSYTHLTLPTKA